MPTGIAIRDPREQLFDATERVLLRDGPGALTSRAVTQEAGVAKGVLHRHFADFDAFLAEFVLDRVERMDRQTAGLGEAVGTGTVAGNLTEALTGLFNSAAVAIVPLVISRDELRARLRRSWPAGVLVLTQAMELIAAYLAAERDLGRVTFYADISAIAAMLIGATHLEHAGLDGAPLEEEAVARIVAGVMSSRSAKHDGDVLADKGGAPGAVPG